MKYTLQDMIAEILREQNRRRKDWQKVPGSYADFWTTEHKQQYKTLEESALILRFMTDREFQTIQDRIERHERDAQAQTKLF